MARKRTTPEWASGPFKEFLNHIEQVQEIFELSMSGFICLTRSKKLADLLAQDGDATSKEAQKQVTSRADRAATEANAGFPNLSSNAAVALWGSFEGLIHHLLKTWLEHRPETMHNEPWSKIKVKAAEYELLDPNERRSYLVDAVEQLLSASLKSGTGRFEPLLEAIALAGTLPDSERRTVLELQQVRNIIVHKRSIADDHFCKMCPWLPIKLGEPFPMDYKKWSEYSHAITLYTTEIYCRVCELFGESNIRNEVAARTILEKTRTENILNTVSHEELAPAPPNSSP